MAPLTAAAGIVLTFIASAPSSSVDAFSPATSSHRHVTSTPSWSHSPIMLRMSEEENAEDSTATTVEDSAEPEEEKKLDPEVVALKESIASLDSDLKAKKIQLSNLKDMADKYSSTGYARQVALVENNKRLRRGNMDDNKSAARAGVLQSFLPVLEEYDVVKQKYEGNGFASTLDALRIEFENSFDDARRIHQPYTDPVHRQQHWKPPPYSSAYMNWKRGMYCMSTAVLAIEPARHFSAHVQLMNQFYEWPRTRMEANIFFKEVFKMPNFWKELGKKIAYGHVAAAGSTAPQLAMWQYIYGGTWSPQDYADWNSYKHLYCAILAVTPCCWMTVPFENARRAYFADKTWPAELRRNYTSPTQALARIPVEEGPYYLFRGGFPLIVNHWTFWTTYLTIYSFHKNKYFFLWLYNDFSYDLCKVVNMSVSFAIASFAAYPAYYTREMVDLWPKERGGHCTWNNEYRKCFKWQIENMDMLGYNFLTNYWQWVKRHGAPYLVALWIADNLGMMSNCNEVHNGLEVISPNAVEII